VKKAVISRTIEEHLHSFFWCPKSGTTSLILTHSPFGFHGLKCKSKRLLHFELLLELLSHGKAGARFEGAQRLQNDQAQSSGRKQK